MYRSLLLAAVLTLTLATTATAAPTVPSFEKVFPHAAKLCAKSDAGTLPAKAVPYKDRIAADCLTLRNSFAPEAADLQATLDNVSASLATIKANVATACTVTPVDKAACRSARADARTQRATLRQQFVTAIQHFRSTNKNSRKVFWNDIRAIKALAHTQADSSSSVSGSSDIAAPTGLNG